MGNFSRNISEIEGVSQGSIAAKLHGFGINKDKLTEAHKMWLDNHVVPLLMSGGSFAVIGEASRSGSSTYNLSLSKRRAENTILYLQDQLNRRFNFSNKTALKPLGFGEAPAAFNKEIDGKENSYYRAVVIAAWLKPSPPEIPIPKKVPPTQTLYKKVTKRSWSSFSDSSRASTADRMHDGGDGAALASLVTSIYDAQTKGGSDKREYKMYPGDFAVVSIKHVNSMIITRSHLVTTTATETTVEYTYSSNWGKSTPVYLHKISSVVDKWVDEKGKPKIKEEKKYWPRKEVWKHTYAPWATVMG